MGFEPKRGDPIGLAGRRLNHSAKVSLTRSTRNHGTQTSAHTNAHTPATHAPLHTTRAPSGNTTQTLARPTGGRTNVHAANTRRCNTPIGVANGKRPRGPMDKASAHGAGDCRFESCRGHLHNTPACRCHLHNSPAAKPLTANTNKTTPRGFEPLRAEPNGFRVHLLNRSDTVSCQRNAALRPPRKGGGRSKLIVELELRCAALLLQKRPLVTVAILAQGTNRAVAVTQAF